MGVAGYWARDARDMRERRDPKFEVQGSKFQNLELRTSNPSPSHPSHAASLTSYYCDRVLLALPLTHADRHILDISHQPQPFHQPQTIVGHVDFPSRENLAGGCGIELGDQANTLRRYVKTTVVTSVWSV